jgi:hypothetical protein
MASALIRILRVLETSTDKNQADLGQELRDCQIPVTDFLRAYALWRAAPVLLQDGDYADDEGDPHAWPPLEISSMRLKRPRSGNA